MERAAFKEGVWKEAAVGSERSGWNESSSESSVVSLAVKNKGLVAGRRLLPVSCISGMWNNRMCSIPAFFPWQFCSHLVRSQLSHVATGLFKQFPVNPAHY